MKNIVKIVVQNIIFWALVIVLCIPIGKILMPKWTKPKDNYIAYIIRGFQDEKKDSIDVIFLGNSDMYRGVTPIELWEKYGLASYNYSAPGQRGWTAYYMLEDLLKTQSPDIIFLNMSGMFSNSDSKIANYCKYFDNINYYDIKAQAFFDDSFGKGFSYKADAMIPIIKFHSRSTDLEKDDFTRAFGRMHNPYKGFSMLYQTKGYKGDYYMVYSKKVKGIAHKAKPYMDKIVARCKDENIKLVLIAAPSATSWNMSMHDYTQAYAKENNLEFLDYNLSEYNVGINWLTDTSDKGVHLNLNGARKLTKCLGEYIDKNYEIKDHRNDKEYEQWNEDLKLYKEHAKNKKTLL